MSVRILYFGATADIAGKRSEELAVAETATAERVLGEVCSRFPALAAHKLHISINQEYARPDTPIHNGDEIAVFTAVSGG